MFYLQQSEISQKLYIDLLEATVSLSNLFTDSNNPFLHYRAMENIFCKAFSAKNLSRSDISADAGKNGVGIGLKTFLQNTGNTFQKVAEFNKDSYLLKDLSGIELIKKVCEMRNERIKTTMNICNFSEMLYHIITRSDKYLAIYEEKMDFVDIGKIRLQSASNNSIHFTDTINEYSYSLSKSTLLKKFRTPDKLKLYGFSVDILEDPYDFLLSAKNNNLQMDNFITSNSYIEDFIVLPLYSPKSSKVESSSGLNQWNAKGRIRNYDEVYIPIPSWIHRYKKEFFSYNTEDYKTLPFDVSLPNGDILKMKVAQQGGKALMSNPNSSLGKWILRDILGLRKGELVTKEKLDIIGIDSIKLSKTRKGTYLLDFLKTGSYELFSKKYVKKG